MTTASKCLVIITTLASLVFFIFISVGTFAGPNYADQMRQDDLSKAYILDTESTVDGDSYSVETRRSFSDSNTPGASSVFVKDSVIKGTRVLPEAVVATRKHLSGKQQDELDELEKNTKIQIEKRTLTESAKKADLLALQARLKGLSDELESKYKELIKLSEDAASVALETVKTQKEADDRRQEGSQIEQQQKEIKTHFDSIVEQIKVSEVLIVRLQGEVDRLEKRNRQLVARGAKTKKTDIIAATKKKSKSVGEK